MRQVRQQIRKRAPAGQAPESAELRFERPDLDSTGALVRSIDLLLSETD